MNSISKQRSAARYPLDSVLGSEANVRLLRILIDAAVTPLGVSDAARQAGLTRAGARRALKRLCECSVVESVGTGRTLQYRMRDHDPLTQSLRVLFKEESDIYHALVFALKSIVGKLQEIREAWMDEPNSTEEALKISIVVEAQAVDWIAGELRTHLSDLEAKYDLVMELAVYTRADVPASALSSVFLKHMGEQNKVKDRDPIQSHTQMEERSFIMSRKIAEMIGSDPSLVTRAKHHLNTLLHDDQGTATAALMEWRQLLENYSIRQLTQFLNSQSSRASRLRQSAPFFAVLTEEERDRLIVSLETVND